MPARQGNISRGIREILQHARVARLATFDAERGPHIVPVCFVYDGKFFYTAIDRKPKSVAPKNLARVRNIIAEPRVALLLDHYDEDWTRLWYILIRATAKLIPESARKERTRVIRKLRGKYPQYVGNMLADDAPIIRITPKRFISWGKP